MVHGYVLVKCAHFVIYLKSPSFEQADLVMLGEVSEAWDLLGKLHHLPDGRGEAHGELLPDLLAGLVGFYVGRVICRTHL